ncbi:MAG: thiamine pyrophosphate-binding protein [Owenweeksia sp.]|nr:thiamine pyrophosphate-binding protein [Owenweeksia sp.]
MKRDAANREYLENFAREASFSDWLACYHVFKHLPSGSVLHTANSASIRYSQLFDHPNETHHYTNRGTSGIDGCTSTAIGHALTTQKPVTLITGDVAFLYDANAFWQHDLPDNLRVVVLNNGGGNIFRIIQGPDKDAVFERFQETVHHHQLSSVAATFDIDFQSVANSDQLLEVLPGFYSENKGRGPRILENKNPPQRNPRVLKSYFRYLKNAVSKT